MQVTVSGMCSQAITLLARLWHGLDTAFASCLQLRCPSAAFRNCLRPTKPWVNVSTRLNVSVAPEPDTDNCVPFSVHWLLLTVPGRAWHRRPTWRQDHD